MDVGFMIGAIFGGLISGCLIGLIPFLIGLKREQKRLGIIAITTCSVAGVLLGALLAIPIAVGFSVVILVKAKNCTMKCPYCAEDINKDAVICKHCKQSLA